MKCNVGCVDRYIRIGLGAVIVVAALMHGSWWAIAGFALIISGLMKWCGLYQIFGLSTYSRRSDFDSCKTMFCSKPVAKTSIKKEDPKPVAKKKKKTKKK
jgi:hypothetical protein